MIASDRCSNLYLSYSVLPYAVSMLKEDFHKEGIGNKIEVKEIIELIRMSGNSR